ncbi:MAG: isoleucine--tRNA ligase [Oscillospiraceae bacterium]|nr:isoleucine--tRNA ligase [Oscillospiraceae bacterium]
MDYNNTVHLPQTDFPMRAGLPKREPEMLEAMKEKKLYHKMVKRNEGKPRFILHDGPPYANGNIHIGTAMNKTLKDIIVKSKNMTGFQAPYVPGWDTHGLPIETAVLKDKTVKREEMSTADFRTKCQEYAEGYIARMTEQFQRLGVLGEWENPYITLKPEFEAKQIEVFGKMAEKGLIYKGMKPVYWCPFDQTALAEAEIEYQDDPCTTIFVKFPVKDDKGKLGTYCDLSKTYFVIWTTTPWTIPGNYAICVNANFDYVLLKAPNGEVYIMAQELCEGVCKQAGIDYAACEVLATLKGSDFELMRAKHPLFDRESVILCGDHVTLEAGTGCVHTAPGFGADDFNICRSYDKQGLTNIGVPVPVNAKGIMTDERYNGQYYAKGNDMVVADLESEGFLLCKENITHSYPHCWRCKHPIIYRATEQWFCSVDAIKKAAVDSCDNIQWHPAWGKDRMVSMISERNDWCISRQRVWGVPIPIFYCDDCGADIVTPETIARVSGLFREHGSNIWFDSEAKDLLPEGFVCPKCGKSHFTKETDIMDVWFDSGSTWAAVADERDNLGYPADLYLEGGDQYRGWFQSSMLTSIACNGVAPYRQIVTHGWTVDGEGKVMHKSLGNAISPDDVLKEYGADIFRLWVASAEYTQDMRISPEILKQLSQAYLKIRNTARYMLGNLAGFDPNGKMAPEKMIGLDRWAVAQLGKLAQTCRAAYHSYDFHIAYRAIYNFCVIEMSNFYLDIIKDRLYCGDKAGRASAQTALYTILDGMTRLIAPILAFTSDEIWAAMPHGKADNAESVLMNDMPDADPAFALSEAEEARWAKVMALRDDVNKALELARSEQSVKKNQDADLTLTFTPEAWKEFEGLRMDESDLAAICIVSAVTVAQGESEGYKGEEFEGLTVKVAPAAGEKCPRCWNHDVRIGTEGHHGELCDRCARVVAAEW